MQALTSKCLSDRVQYRPNYANIKIENITKNKRQFLHYRIYMPQNVGIYKKHQHKAYRAPSRPTKCAATWAILLAILELPLRVCASARLARPNIKAVDNQLRQSSVSAKQQLEKINEIHRLTSCRAFGNPIHVAHGTGMKQAPNSKAWQHISTRRKMLKTNIPALIKPSIFKYE